MPKSKQGESLHNSKGKGPMAKQVGSTTTTTTTTQEAAIFSNPDYSDCKEASSKRYSSDHYPKHRKGISHPEACLLNG